MSDGSSKQCLPGTQVAILDEITDWINGVRQGSQDQPILLLHGMAGTGKSSIAHTIASRFKALSRLGASFAFSRSDNSRRVGQLFPHIAALLADFHPAIKSHLSTTLAQNSDVLASHDLGLQFTELVLRPLNALTMTGPVVIVLDAIDEVDEDGVQLAELVSLLVKEGGQLPPNVRILITSRSEAYILDQIQSSAVFRLSMSDFSDATLFDIGVFIRVIAVVFVLIKPMTFDILSQFLGKGSDAEATQA